MEKLDFRIEKTYLALYNAFTSLLEEKHFEDFTINDLCERAMIRRTTFYKHFADKYDYFAFYLKETCASLQNKLKPDILSDSINPYFLNMCRELIRFMNRNSKIVKNVLESKMFYMIFDILSDQIRTDLLQGLHVIYKDTDVDNEKLEAKAAYYAGGMLNIVHLWLKNDKELDEEKFTEVISSLLV